MLIDTIQALCSLPGVSSGEEAVRAYIQKEISPHCESIRTDTMGNLIAKKKGTAPGTKKLMLAAHMDEVGLIVHSITDEGYLKCRPVGGIDRRVLLGKRVLVGKDQLPGLIGLKAYHLTTAEEEKQIPKWKDLVIDIGAHDGDEAKAWVTPGDLVSFDSDVVFFGRNNMKAKALDDRVGCAVLVELLKQPLPMDCTFVFTVQEEVGTRGAFGAAFSVKPDLALILEGTTAADLPGMKPHQKICAPGKGPVIPYMDGATVYDRGLFDLLRTLAEENSIPWQTKEYIAGGTDAGAIQRSREGVRAAAISAAVRYIHSPSSVVALDDCQQMLQLARLFVTAVSTMN